MQRRQAGYAQSSPSLFKTTLSTLEEVDEENSDEESRIEMAKADRPHNVTPTPSEVTSTETLTSATGDVSSSESLDSKSTDLMMRGLNF